MGYEREFRVCMDHARGACKRDKCTYVHNANENASSGADICVDFDRGRCTRENCRYGDNWDLMLFKWVVKALNGGNGSCCCCFEMCASGRMWRQLGVVVAVGLR